MDRLSDTTCTGIILLLSLTFCHGLMLDGTQAASNATGNIKSAFSATNIQRHNVSHPSFFLTPVYYYARFINVLLNDGGDYDSNSGKFTCRIPGLYIFSTTLTEKQFNDDIVNCRLYKNNMAEIQLVSYTAADDTDVTSASASLALHLNKYDTVYLSHCDHGNGFDGSASSFSGILVKPDNF